MATPTALEPKPLTAGGLLGVTRPTSAGAGYYEVDATAGASSVEVTVTNLFSQTGYVSIVVLPDGATFGDEHYVVHRQAVHGHQTRVFALPFLNDNDDIQVWADGHAKCLLNEALDNSETEFDYDTATGGTFAAAGRAVVQDDATGAREEFDYTGFSGTQFTGVTRGVGGTAPDAHDDNTAIYNHHMVCRIDGVLETA